MFACASARRSADSCRLRNRAGAREVRQIPDCRPARGAHHSGRGRNVTKVRAGVLVGRVALAYLAVVIISRRKLIRLFQVPGLLVMPLTFAIAGTTNLNWLYVGMFFAGLFTVGQFSFWGNYLPRVYPLYLRGTGKLRREYRGQIDRHVIRLTATLAVTPNRAYAPVKVAYVAAAVGFSVYLVGLIASFWLPEPPKENLPD